MLANNAQLKLVSYLYLTCALVNKVLFAWEESAQMSTKLHNYS